MWLSREMISPRLLPAVPSSMSCLSASHRLAVPHCGANNETNGVETDASVQCHHSLWARHDSRRAALPLLILRRTLAHPSSCTLHRCFPNSGVDSKVCTHKGKDSMFTKISGTRGGVNCTSYTCKVWKKGVLNECVIRQHQKGVYHL